MSEVFDVLDGIVEKHLQTTKIGRSPYFKNKTNALNLTAPAPNFSAEKMLDDMYSHLKNSWVGTSTSKSLSPENWRWKPLPESTTTPEGKLERAIVDTENSINKNDDWTNQIPVASGLFQPTGGSRAIDLGHRLQRGVEYELFELKVDKNNALSAAMQIIQYSVLYVFARSHPEAIHGDPELLKAREVHLNVLAPTAYYNRYSLGWLVDHLNTGLQKFTIGNGLNLQMDFKFMQFPEYFELSCDSTALNKALRDIHPVQWK